MEINSLSEHFDVVWKVLSIVAAALYLVVKFVFNDYKKRIAQLEAHKTSVELQIPLLMTTKTCTDARNNCINAVLLKQLSEDLTVIKQAQIILIMNSKDIPQSERDKIAKELLA